ncbi:MAG: hypothetical protein AAF570_24250, partial [Bacteroidota bacterium]
MRTLESNGTGAGWDYAQDVFVSDAGFTYFTGDFGGQATLGDTTISCPTSNCAFVARYGPDGSFDWARNTISAGSASSVGGEVVDNGVGVIAMASEFLGTIQSNPPVTSVGNRDVYIRAYDEQGTESWQQHIGGPGEESLFGMETDQQGNIYALVRFEGEITVGSDTYTILDPADFHPGFVLVKFDGAGNLIWSRGLYETIPGPAGAGTSVSDLSSDANDRLRIAGSLSGPSLLIDTLYTNPDTSYMFSLSVRPDGGLESLQISPLSSRILIWDYVADAQGNDYFIFFFSLFGADPFEVEGLDLGNGSQFALARRDASGNWNWAQGGLPSIRDLELGADQFLF